ncbi:MAG: radical SAM protein, partial [Chromatiales bacterium]|nr:radical SAM protein [Chromatiales bacterium]
LRAGCETVPGFLLRTTDGLIEAGVPEMLPQVDSLPSPFRIPRWPLDRYPLGVLFSNRGCPHNCAFCYTPAASGRRLSQRVREGVLKDIVEMAKANVEHVFFADPVFLPSAHRPLQLLEDLRELDTGLTFNCELRTEAVTPATLRAMRDAGFISISYGLETASSSVLDGVNKHVDLVRFREIVQMTLEHGIMVELFCIHGLPGQTVDDIKATFDFIESCGPAVQAAAAFQQLQLYFGIELLRDPGRYGIEIIGKRPPYLSPATSFRTASLGPDEFRMLEQEWEARVKPVQQLFGINTERTNALRH